MDQIDLFILLVVFHFLMYLLELNVYALLVSYLAIFIETGIVIAGNNAYSIFAVMVLLFLTILTVERVSLDRKQQQGRSRARK